MSFCSYFKSVFLVEFGCLMTKWAQAFLLMTVTIWMHLSFSDLDAARSETFHSSDSLLGGAELNPPPLRKKTPRHVIAWHHPSSCLVPLGWPTHRSCSLTRGVCWSAPGGRWTPDSRTLEAGYRTAHLQIAHSSLSPTWQEMRLNGTICTIRGALLFLLMAMTASILRREAVSFLEKAINNTLVSTKNIIHLCFRTTLNWKQLVLVDVFRFSVSNHS